MKLRKIQYLFISVLVIAFLLPVFLIVQNTGTAASSTTSFIQAEPEATVIPAVLERLSWSAVIAGTVLSLILMFVLNLFGVALGFSQINPEYGQESSEPMTIAATTFGWLGASNLVALFAGGWLAAYFAGVPETMDGFLHGIMVWALTGIITTLLVMSGLGRVMNGLAAMINSGLQLTESIASGTANMAGNALQTAGSAVGSTAGAAGSLTAQSLATLAQGVNNSAQLVGNSVNNMTDTAIENTPEVQNALEYQDLTFDQIRMAANQLMRDAGIDPNAVEGQAQAVAQDARASAEQAARHPEYANQILTNALNRVFRRGESLASEVDREALMNVMAENTNMSREEITRQISEWEDQFNSVKQQTQQAREVARQKAEEFRQKAEQRAQAMVDRAREQAEEMQHEVEQRMQEARREAEERAREAAQTASDSFVKIATAAALAIILGGVAAGIGGILGTPDELPDVDIDEVSHPSYEVFAEFSDEIQLDI